MPKTSEKRHDKAIIAEFLRWLFEEQECSLLDRDGDKTDVDIDDLIELYRGEKADRGE